MILWLLLAADHAHPLGLSEGTAPLDVSGAASAETCRPCHQQVWSEWQDSRHRQSHTNAIYEAGLIVETRMFCVHCHSPLEEQVAEVAADLPWYRSRDPRMPHRPPTPERAPAPLASEGITCVVCHVRDGQVLSSSPPASGNHTYRRAELKTELCAGCHEFRMPAFTEAGLELTDTPMQSTYSEWRAWGGDQTCAGCHMPGGAHVFHGAHDLDLLRSSVAVRADRRGEHLVFTLQSQGVGHHLPTGDLYRHLTLEVSNGVTWTTVQRIGRVFDLVDTPAGIRKVLVDDTSLRPGEPRVMLHPAAGVQRWRLVYHYGSGQDEARDLIPADLLTVVVAESEA